MSTNQQSKDITRLRHMLDHGREAVALLQGKTKAELKNNRVLHLALVRLIEIVGEAANRVSKGTQEHYPQIPWSQIVGMRNRLIHGYEFLDFDILWQTVTEDLPKLIDELEQIVPSEEEN